MSRQQRRQQTRKADAKTAFPWEKVIIIGVLAFFVIALGLSYLFPSINARSYATGSERVHRMIINRAMKDLETRTEFEFVFYGMYEAEGDEHEDEPHMHWAEYVVNEKSGVATFKDGATREAVEEADLITDYYTLQSTIAAIDVALNDSEYKVSYAGTPDSTELVSALFLEREVGEEHSGYIMYFTDDHKIDNIEVLEKIGPEEYSRYFYFGVTSGVPDVTPTP
ncbi:MAG TPA: hypothetical protein VK905_04150 [Bacillota bacterium]|nr:hypothetical protein [Bacillota bacterium]